MSSIEAIRDRIETTESLESVVHVMKALSAASITRAEETARRLREYQDVVDRGLQATLAQLGISALADEPTRTSAIIVLGSDWGLCGRFNEVSVDRATAMIHGRQRVGEHVAVAAVGLRANNRLEASGLDVEAFFSQPASVSGLTGTVEQLLVQILAWREAGRADRVVLVHNAMRDRSLNTLEETLLPLAQEEIAEIAERSWPSRCLPMLDANPEETFSALVRERLFVALMRSTAESLAAEHATRLATMQAAERNIAEALDELQADFRRERQNAITTELMDIVTAYGAVRDKGEGEPRGSDADDAVRVASS